MRHDHAVMFKQLANQSGVSLERLASLCQVAEAGSIGQASRGDVNRQSLLSRQIAELEVVFGVALLARQSRPFRLTPEGRELAQAARQFFQVADDIQKRASGQAQRVVIGAGETLIQWLLFPVCEAIRKRGADVVFVFKNLESSRLVEELQHGEVDLALLRKEEVLPSLSSVGDWRYKHTAFVPKALSRATTEVKVGELAALPWAVLEGRGHFRQFIESKARAHGITANIALECSSYTQVAMAVQTGRYAGFLPEFAKNAMFTSGSNCCQRALEANLRYERTLSLAWRDATTRSRPFVEELIPEMRAKLSRLL